MTAPDPATTLQYGTTPDWELLGDLLIDLGREIKANGPRRLDLARQLAAVGYPSSTLGSGGGRSSDATSTTERAAGVDHEQPRPNRWALMPLVIAQRAAALERAAREFRQPYDLVGHHASDVDPVPAGSGECQACEKVVRHNPLKNDNNRLRSGLCRSDFDRWDRYRKATPDAHLPDWIRARRRELGLPERILLGSTT